MVGQGTCGIKSNDQKIESWKNGIFKIWRKKVEKSIEVAAIIFDSIFKNQKFIHFASLVSWRNFQIKKDEISHEHRSKRITFDFSLYRKIFGKIIIEGRFETKISKKEIKRA